MFALRPASCELLFRLFLAQFRVSDYEISHDKTKSGANRPGENDAVENPIGKPHNVGQGADVSAVAKSIADANGINARYQPDGKREDRFAAGAGENWVFGWWAHRQRNDVRSNVRGLRSLSGGGWGSKCGCCKAAILEAKPPREDRTTEAAIR